MRPDLELQLIEAADRELPELPTDSYRRRRWASEVHCLADNRLGCFAGLIRVEEAAGQLRNRADEEGWPPRNARRPSSTSPPTPGETRRNTSAAL